MIAKSLYSSFAHSVLTEQTIWKAKFPCSFLWIPTTVSGKDFILASGLWGLCSVINKLVLLVLVVMSHDHVHHSLHEGLEHIVVKILDWLEEWLKCVSESIIIETKSWECNKLWQSLCVLRLETYDHSTK